MAETDTDVIIVGAGPTGLMLARELGLQQVSTLVLERREQPNGVARAGGLGGRMLDMLHYRGLLTRFEAASGLPRPEPRFPFGSLHVDLTALDDPPMQALRIPQPQMEGLLEELATESGAEVRRGHEVVGLDQDEHRVTVEISGPEGTYRARAGYLVGCDGVHSRVREMAGIAFPGVTYPEVNRLGTFGMPATLTLLDNGDYQVPGYGRLPSGYTQTPRGVFAISSYTPNDLGIYTSEEEPAASYDDDTAMTVTEFSESVRRVLGVSIPLERPTRLTRFTFGARQVDRYRSGRILVAGDAAHQFPSGGVAVTAAMLDSVNLAWKLAATLRGWAPGTLLDTYHEERHLAGTRTMLHTQAQVALRRGLDPAADALRELFAELLTDEQTQRRIGAFIAGTDIRYPMPCADPHPLAGRFAPDLALRTGGAATSIAELMHAARPVFVDLAGRGDLLDVAQHWRSRVEIHAGTIADRPADALLIRPDGYIAWAGGIGEPVDSAAPELRAALSYWFG